MPDVYKRQDEYIDGYQVAYSVLTNIDKVVHMQKEQSVTYESLPGFVAKYQVRQTGGDVNLTLLEANSRFLEYFGKDGNRVTSSLYRKNIQDNIETINEYRADMLSGAPLHFVMHVESRYGQALWLQINATCVDWQEGCPVYLAIFIDITDVTEMRSCLLYTSSCFRAITDTPRTCSEASSSSNQRSSSAGCCGRSGRSFSEICASWVPKGSSNRVVTILNRVCTLAICAAGLLGVNAAIHAVNGVMMQTAVNRAVPMILNIK